MTAFKKRRICGVSQDTLQSAFGYFYDNLAGFVSISENKSFSPSNLRMSSIPALAYYGLLPAYCRLVTYTNNCSLNIESQQLIICSLKLKYGLKFEIAYVKR